VNDMWNGFYGLPCEDQESCYEPILSLTIKADADVVQVEDLTSQAFDRRGSMWRSDTQVVCQDQACVMSVSSPLVKQVLRLRHTCAGGIRV
jgi:hypothetical protein